MNRQPGASLVFSIGDLHPETTVAHDLMQDGYHALAVQEAAQRFINRVQELSGRADLDGVTLLEHAFSEKQPLLAFSERESLREQDEHRGYQRLSVGLAFAVRNVLAHQAGAVLDPIEAMEWLGFISVMHRRLDGVRQITPPSDELEQSP